MARRRERDASNSASGVLAFCDMRTLYLRNVPDVVGDRLERLAKREGMSVSAFVVRELEQLSRRADNAALLGELPDIEVDTEPIIVDLAEGRSNR